MTAWSSPRTAWHPLLVLLIEQLLPRERWQTVPEFQLSREPLRIDVVLIRRTGEPAAEGLLRARPVSGCSTR